MNTVNLADLASLLQLAAGLCLAGAVIIQHHRSLLEPEEEYLAYARTIAAPRVAQIDAREKLEFAAAEFENAIFQAKLMPFKTLRRLVVLNIVSGVFSTILVALPAFHVLQVISIPAAMIVSFGSFAPLVMSLAYVRLIRFRYSNRIGTSKEKLGLAMRQGLNPDELSF